MAFSNYLLDKNYEALKDPHHHMIVGCYSREITLHVATQPLPTDYDKVVLFVLACGAPWIRTIV